MNRWGPEKWLLAVTSVLISVTAMLALIGWVAGQPTFYRYAFRCGVVTICVWTIPFAMAILFVLFEKLRYKQKSGEEKEERDASQ